MRGEEEQGHSRCKRLTGRRTFVDSQIVQDDHVARRNMGTNTCST